MKDPKKMTYKEMELEVTECRIEMRRATLERKRVLIARSHSLMVEMDRRWQNTVTKKGC